MDHKDLQDLLSFICFINLIQNFPPKGTYETEGEGSSPVVEGNYRTTEGRNGGVLGQSTAEETSGGREGRDRGRGRAPCLWEASYYTGDRIPAYQRPAYKPTI